MKITKIYGGINIINLTDEYDLCDDGNILSNNDRLLKIGNLPRVEAKNWNYISNKCWNTADGEMERRKIMISKQIFEAFSEKNAYLICPYNQFFYEHNDLKVTKVYSHPKKI